MVKILAFHLPQYHCFPENDAWWGKGFTDWDNVRNAVPLYEGHYQPRVPLDGYYNMLDINTHKRQAYLAKKYGIYGFCYYHYWFNGKKLMEKPLEMILEEKEIDLPFCLCWANEPWTRSWDGKSKEVIMQQEYGSEKDWLEHIEYLLPFFKDERYIKINGMPILIIYRTNEIKCCDDMIKLWNNKCREAGLQGLYVCEERNAFQDRPSCKCSKGILNFEPSCTKRITRKTSNRIKKEIGMIFGKDYVIRSYKKDVDEIVNRPVIQSGKQEYLGAFVGWDNTPRRKSGGEICEGRTTGDFRRLIEGQIEKSEKIGADFLFINAWNEWAEGAYLEPDVRDGYSYLEVVASVQNPTKGNENENGEEFFYNKTHK